MQRLLVSSLATLVVAGSAAAAEECSTQGIQYADTRTCVSSVRAPQGDRTYGPDQMSGLEPGAWCEGVDGSGIGETITLHHDNRKLRIGSLSFANGNPESPEGYSAYGRIKRARIETNRGYRQTVSLKDVAEYHVIRIRPHKFAWVRVTILDVYPGTTGDTCIATLYLNLEDNR